MATLQYVLATACSLIVFVLLVNVVVDLYARGAVRAAIDEGVARRRADRRVADELHGARRRRARGPRRSADPLADPHHLSGGTGPRHCSRRGAPEQLVGVGA